MKQQCRWPGLLCRLGASAQGPLLKVLVLLRQRALAAPMECAAWQGPLSSARLLGLHATCEYLG